MVIKTLLSLVCAAMAGSCARSVPAQLAASDSVPNVRVEVLLHEFDNGDGPPARVVVSGVPATMGLWGNAGFLCRESQLPSKLDQGQIEALLKEANQQIASMQGAAAVLLVLSGPDSELARPRYKLSGWGVNRVIRESSDGKIQFNCYPDLKNLRAGTYSIEGIVIYRGAEAGRSVPILFERG